jgi:hypothetical protein
MIGKLALAVGPVPEETLTGSPAAELDRAERLLSGSLSQFSVAELLQTVEVGRRSGTVLLRSRGRGATLWLRGGRIVDAVTDLGLRGKDAVFSVALWDEGSFEADFRPVAATDRIGESTSFLLLEAMRRHDEAEREAAAPPHAALPDSPPPPPRGLRAVHRALTLLAVSASYASEHMTEALVEKRLEAARLALLDRHPLLDGFRVEAAGRPALFSSSSAAEAPVEQLVEAVAAWLRRFFADSEEALPGRFQLRRLRQVTEAVSEDMHDLGFYRALDLEDAPQENAT